MLSIYGLQQLNSNGIYYADIKLGNIGWSTGDRCWKLFDFDMAGTVSGITPDLLDMGYPDSILDLLMLCSQHRLDYCYRI